MITLSFQVFDTRSGYDHVLLYDGIDTSAPLFASLSGSLVSSQAYTSTQQYMYVRFITDWGTTATGFNATYASSSGRPVN